MPRWEMASSSFWVAAWRIALGSCSWRRRMSLRPERGQKVRSEGCLGLRGLRGAAGVGRTGSGHQAPAGRLTGCGSRSI